MTFRHTFFKTQILKRRAAELNAWHEIDELKKILDVRPDAGDVIPGGDGLRKIRIPLHGKGKRGGARVIYYFLAAHDAIILVYMFAKNEIADISQDYLKELIAIRNAAVQQHAEILNEKRLAKRVAGRGQSHARRPLGH